MDDEDVVVDLTQPLDLPQVVHDIAEVVPVEALPVDPLPVHAVTWLSRLLSFFGQHAYFLTFAGALIENTIFLGFLLPGGAVVALAGAGGRRAELSLPVLIVLATAGMVGGAIIDYLLGRAGIARLLHHPLMGRWGIRMAHQLEQAEPLLSRHGWWIMLLAHAFGTGRSALAVAAGASGLPWRRFLVMEAPAALLWSTVYAGGGYVLASQWSTFELILRRVGWVGTVVAVVVIGGWYFWQRRLIRASVQATLTPAGTGAGATVAPASAGSTNGKVVSTPPLGVPAPRPASRLEAPPPGPSRPGPSGQPAEPVH
jgi:membrane-associated protein